VKYVREYKTGDRGQTIQVPKASAENLANEFLSELQAAKSRLRVEREFSDPEFQKSLASKEFSSVYMIRSLLLKPEELLVQKKIKLLKFQDQPVEVRVDFNQGAPLNASLRYGRYVGIDFETQAMKFMQKVLAEGPAQLLEMAGGADVVFAEDGTPWLMELNVENESGFIQADSAPIQANQFYSATVGRPTFLIRKLNRLAEAGLKEQAAYLSKTNPTFEEYEHFDLDNLPLLDVFQYLRDQMIRKWLEKPTAAGAEALNQRFGQLFESQVARLSDVKTKDAFRAMVDSAADYFSSKLIQAN
jgi:hypothetical protein